MTKMINGKQCIILWCTDDNKTLHVDPKVNDAIVEEVKIQFGNLIVARGKKYSLLGMSITISDDCKIELEMKDQTQEAIDTFGEDISDLLLIQ